ncbi:50S ribosomal protein L19 [Patescibacteria group bacterium]|nr:50S ribosomal protein L19 [Patescibacteria group bacterium]MCL5797737.1 50S ribosomal protein L19 [Patescibacteria group bacterium]
MANQALHENRKFNVGDTIKVHYKLIEKEKVSGKTKKEVKEEVRERIQIFEGIVIAIRGVAENRSFTVRRIGAGGIGVERVFPLSSPWIKKITVEKRGKVRRAKLYYLRGKVGKKAEQLEERGKVLPEKEDTKETKKNEERPESSASLANETKK